MVKVNKVKLKKFFLGKNGQDGFLYKLFIYILLIGISFIFLYPLLKMTAKSLMTLEDLVDSTKNWIPSKPTLKNYTTSIRVLNFSKAIKDSFFVALVPTAACLISSALIGYGFACFDFPLKKIFFAILVLMFLVPNILTNIPTYVKYNQLGMLRSIKAYLYPALTGFGLRQTVFILIFYQFFRVIPKELFEAAEVDGASVFKIFFTIAIPMSSVAFLICGLYSFVWYWNETSLALSYFSGKYQTLAMAVSNFRSRFYELFPSGDSLNDSFNEGIIFAGTMLSIIPLLIIYLFTQKWFIESNFSAILSSYLSGVRCVLFRTTETILTC